VSEEKPLTREQLEKMNRLHRMELKKIRKMTESQFQAFKKNFTVGLIDNISKIEAEELLTSMVTLNLKLQSELPKKENEN